jgi:hypothetical protein
MLRAFAVLLPLLALAPAPAAAQAVQTVQATTTIYQSAEGTFTETAVTGPDVGGGGSDRVVAPQPAPVPRGIARFGPFRVLDPVRAALVDVTDADSPRQFAALLKAFPGIALIEMIECPGTEDDRANLQLGRMIRQRGIATHVPAGGSVRSGGVELFLAGTQRFADPGAEFAVHSWEDDTGRQADDYAANAPQNVKYLDYYREMGMSAAEAGAFYAMTNAVPFETARWFGAEEMAKWVRLD